MQILIQGNLFEGNSGPDIILSGTAAVSIHNNYFECNSGENDGSGVRPAMILHPTVGYVTSPDIAIHADIVLSGMYLLRVALII